MPPPRRLRSRAKATNNRAESPTIKRELLTLRRCVWPQREALSVRLRGDLAHFTEETRVDLRDCYDHVVPN